MARLLYGIMTIGMLLGLAGCGGRGADGPTVEVAGPSPTDGADAPSSHDSLPEFFSEPTDGVAEPETRSSKEREGTESGETAAGTDGLTSRPTGSDGLEIRSTAERAQTEYRPDDGRPRHNAGRLEAFGIRTFESKRLRLHTDIDPEIAGALPPLIDQAYDAWEEYFGPLPPNRAGTEYQMTGYIMADKDLFRQTGLLPADLAPFINGRHRGAEFWMNDQRQEYYLRHLAIHEATHCFMTTMPDVRAPVWYMEGMAELFGTHWIDDQGQARFRVMPHNDADFLGLGRLTIVQLEIAAGRFHTVADVQAFNPGEFLQNEKYAWSWALCAFFDGHPRYRERFREMGQHLTGTQFPKAYYELFGPDLSDLRTEWSLFAHGLREGYDLERTAIAFRPGLPLESLAGPDGTGPVRIEVAADRGWQSSGVRLEQGRTYEVAASGRFTLADRPKPWTSEPQGISFRYFQGRPLGMLLGAVRRTAPDDDEPESMLRVIPLGRQARFEAPWTGTLYLCINDSWSELADNRGKVQVEIRAGQPAE